MPFNTNRRYRDQSGQVLLIVVLVAVISLTVGLAAVSRSITNTRVSTEESNSQKALSAAEAGLEAQIQKANETPDENMPELNGNFEGSAKYTATSTKKNGPEVVFNDYKVPVSKSEGADVWLSLYPDFTFPTPAISPELDIYWKNADSNSCGTGANANPAIEIVVLRGPDKNDPILDRYAVDSCRGRGNGFVAPTQDGNLTPITGKPTYVYNHRFRIGPINNGYIVRIIPIYNDALIAVKTVGGVSLPGQGFDIVSEGTSGETTRKVKVFQSFPTVPIEIFPYNLFNP